VTRAVASEMTGVETRLPEGRLRSAVERTVRRLAAFDVASAAEGSESDAAVSR
jgi:hypothetical protein